MVFHILYSSNTLVLCYRVSASSHSVLVWWYGCGYAWWNATGDGKPGLQCKEAFYFWAIQTFYGVMFSLCFVLFVLISICGSACVQAPDSVVWRSEDTLESALSPTSPDLHGKHFYLQSHITACVFFFCFVWLASLWWRHVSLFWDGAKWPRMPSGWPSCLSLLNTGNSNSVTVVNFLNYTRQWCLVYLPSGTHWAFTYVRACTSSSKETLCVFAIEIREQSIILLTMGK